MSFLTIVLSSLLFACTFKNVEANFDVEEIVVSVNDSIDINSHLTVEGVAREEVSLKFSNSSLFEINGNVVTAKSTGKSFVYATYKNNSIASMQIVVRKNFDAPTNFKMNENGLVSWNAVSSFYENEKEPTVAQKYVVEGVRITYDKQDPSIVLEREEFVEIVVGNSFQLPNVGEYNLVVRAERFGWFDDGEFSEVQSFHFGFMDEIKQDEMSWENGILTWNAVEGAKYKVQLDDILLDEFQYDTTKDLTSHFSRAKAGQHRIVVFAFDEKGVKLTKASEELVVTKLEAPEVSYKNGMLEIANVYGSGEFKLMLNNTQTLSFDSQDEDCVLTNLEGVEAGIYDVKIFAVAKEGLFFDSDVKQIGKVYKLGTVQLSGVGDNDIDGTTYKLLVEGESLVSTQFEIVQLQESFQGFADESEKRKELVLTFEKAGKYNFSVIQKATNEINFVDNEKVFVLNSDDSQSVEVTKVGQFSNSIKHGYNSGNSVFTFQAVEFATSYSVQVFDVNSGEFVEFDGNYEVSIGENVSIEFEGRIEKLFKEFETLDENNLQFRIIANTKDEKFAINSSAIKNLRVLNSPESLGSGNSTNKYFEWQSVTNASKYRVEIFGLTKEFYELNKDKNNIDVSAIEPDTLETTQTRIEIENVGYYYVKVYAISVNEDVLISSRDCLSEMFFVAEKLTLGEVEFGFDEELKNDFTDSSGYFVKVSHTVNVENYEISLSSNGNFHKKLSGDFSLYILTDNFISSVEIGVVGHGVDETLYWQTEQTKIFVEKLSDIQENDLIVDERANTLIVEPKEGVTKIAIRGTGKQVIAVDGKPAVYNLPKENAFELSFELGGSSYSEASKTYQISNGKVFLPSEIVTYKFERVAQPSSFRYENGYLKFTDEQVGNAICFVVDFVCTLPDDSQIALSLFLNDKVEMVYDDLRAELGLKEDFVSVINGNEYSVNLNSNESPDKQNVIEMLKNNSIFAPIYNQAKSLSFQVYAQQRKFVNEKMLISSLYGTLQNDLNNNELEIKKMKSTSLTYSIENNLLVWDAVSNDVSVSSSTTYIITSNAWEGQIEVKGLTSYDLSEIRFETAKEYEFYVTATNPNFLESESSNKLVIRKLKAVSQMVLNENNLSFTTTETGFSKILLYIDNSDSQELSTQSFKISGDGEYSIRLIGQVQEQTAPNDEQKIISRTYILDSDLASWQVKNMRTLVESPLVVNFDGNRISYSSFNESLSSLEYVVTFEDKNAYKFSYVTTELFVDLTANENLVSQIGKLSAGDIKVGVYAHLKPYTVVADGIIYFFEENEAGFNYYPYTSNHIIKKLSTPTIESVEFVYNQESGNENYLSDAQSPVIKVVFTGNYGNGKFQVFFNERLLEGLSVTQVEDKYEFVLTNEVYDNVASGEAFAIKIRALNIDENASAIPSTDQYVEIVRADNLQSIEFVSDEQGNLTPIIKLSFGSAEQVLGGFVIGIESEMFDSENLKIMNIGDGTNGFVQYNLSEFLKDKISQGGEITISAFVNNYSNSRDKIFLASPRKISMSAVVLKSVKQSDILLEEGGFVIPETMNSENTVYTLVCKDKTFVLSKENQFKFVYPNDWTNSTYEFNVVANENGFVQSVVSKISISLERIASIDAVKLSRSNENAVTLSWDAVPNSNGYIINMYNINGDLLYSYKTSKTSNTFSEIFGENYSKLLRNVNFDEEMFKQDLPVRFGIVTVGDGAGSLNNSQEYVFNAIIKGNNLQIEDVGIDEFGILRFNSSVGKEYMYRFVSASDSQTIQDWRLIEASGAKTQLDTSDLILNGAGFNVEIVVKGSVGFDEILVRPDSDFSFDSIAMTSTGEMKTFYKSEEIERIETNEESCELLNFVLNTHEQDFKIFVGVNENAISLGQVVEFVPEQNVDLYSYNLALLMTALKEQGYVVNDKLHFWVLVPTESEQATNVVSSLYSLDVNVNTDVDFLEIVKLGNETGNPNIEKDFINTFAKFRNNDNENFETLGIYVKLVQISQDPFTVTKFVSKDKLLTNDYFDDSVFVINLNKLFDDEDLKELSGRFKIEFAKFSIVNGIRAISDWFVLEEEFIKLPKVELLELKNGNLIWNYNDENSVKFLIYFAQELNSEQLGENYFYHETERNSYNASEHITSEHQYYLAVQSINENPYVLSSQLTFVSDEYGAIRVYKNQIKSDLKLRDGKLVIDWIDGDFIGKFKETITDYASFAEDLVKTTFTSPFTFTMADLVDENVKIRLTFTSKVSGATGISKSFDVPAINLLSNLFDFGLEGVDIKQILQDTIPQITSSTTQQIVRKFKEAIENGSHGIANSKFLFDYYFEALQTGAFELKYCLLGNNKTLTSGWYGYKNERNENEIYVNAEPNVNVLKVSDSSDVAKNIFKVVFKKSVIKALENDSVVSQTATSYVLVIGKNVFALDARVGSLKLLGGDEESFVNVYESDSSGVELRGGDYLMFYINYNNGKSLLGVYEENIQKGSFAMQLFAVGNDYSISSKSKYISITFMSIEDFSMVDGEFVWSSVYNRKTTVFVQRSDSSIPERDEVEGLRATSTYSLAGKGAGAYSLKFVVMGEVRNNVVYVDSDIYQISRLYKLSAPVLSNDLGYISINAQMNLSNLSNCYSDEKLHRFKMYNSASTAELYNILIDERENKQSPLLYEVGITGMTDKEPDYEYKKTETLANWFQVMSLGTTATLSKERDESFYYIKNLVCPEGKNVAVRSDVNETTRLNAGMMSEVKNIQVQNGVLTWDDVTWGGSVETPLQIPENASVVYKVTVVQYKTDLVEGVLVETNVNEPKEYYTALNSFDFARLQEEELPDLEGVLIKTIVQALALNVSEDYILNATPLIEGGYANGNIQFVGTERYVLMGNGTQIGEIGRLKAVDDNSIRVENGQLVWNYTSTVQEDLFNDYYSFVVVDDENKQIYGTFEVVKNALSNPDGSFIYKITFSEEKDSMKTGTYNVKIFVSQGLNNPNVVIKSFARTFEITKLMTVTANDFEISSDSTRETLSLSKYFEKNPENILHAEIKTVGGETKTLELTSTRSSFNILSEATTPVDDYSIVIDGDSTVLIKYYATFVGHISSDISNEFALKRSSWGVDSQILWDRTKQEFTWNFSLHTINERAIVEEKRVANILSVNTLLFNDAQMVEYAGITLERGTEIEITQNIEASISVQILHNGILYYISRSNFERKIVDVLDENEAPVSIEIDGTTLFKVVEEMQNETIIEIDGRLYAVSKTVTIIKPTYIIEAKFKTNNGEIIRNYETTEKVFRPTIISGSVQISVRIRLNSTSIQSQAKLSEEVAFNLFASGNGTKDNPYSIENVRHFTNMKYRQTKDAMLVEYVEERTINGVQVPTGVMEEERYYFNLKEGVDFNVGEFAGFLFAGDFSGVVEGHENTITYVSSNVATLSESKIVRVEDTNLNPTNPARDLTFTKGSALFETLTSTAEIKNINLDATFSNDPIIVRNHALIAGLAIYNNGKISYVNLTKFKNMFNGNISDKERTVMSYSGIVSINQGNASIKNCQAKTSMEISDQNYSQLIFLSGIVYTNYATIEDCVSGIEGTDLQLKVLCQEGSSAIQIAGIVVTSTQSSTLLNCRNHYNISASGNVGNSNVAYLAGIADLVKCSYDINEFVSTGEISTSRLTNVTQNDIFAVVR